MRCILLGLGLASVLAAPARATDWDSVAGWDIYEIDASRCVVGRVFAEAGTTFGIIMSLDGEVRVFATAAGWSARPGEKVDAAVGLDADILVAGPAVGIAKDASQGFVLAAGETFLTRFAGARQLSVRMGSAARIARVALAGSSAGLAQGRRCLANLRDERARPAPVTVASTGRTALPPPAARPERRPSFASLRSPVPAMARGSRASWIAADDYPDDAIRAEEQGSVTVKLAIDPRGGVADCHVVRSSGSRALDGATCRVIQRRARYRPAIDSRGYAIAGVDLHTVHWTLPRD